MSWDEFLARFQERHPEWFGDVYRTTQNAGGFDLSPVSPPKAPRPEKHENEPMTPRTGPGVAILDRQSQAAGDDWDAAEVVEVGADEPEWMEN